MKNAEYKTTKENYEDALAEARTMSIGEIKNALKDRNALHTWAVRAYEDCIAEYEGRRVKLNEHFGMKTVEGR